MLQQSLKIIKIESTAKDKKNSVTLSMIVGLCMQSKNNCKREALKVSKHLEIVLKHLVYHLKCHACVLDSTCCVYY